MIKYQLKCGAGCAFEGWFPSSDDFDRQANENLLECPLCGSPQVAKAVMAPAIARRRNARPTGARSERLAEIKQSMNEAATRARDYVEKNFDYVGERFPEEARRIHYGETKPRGVYGEATGSEVKELVDEGVPVAPLPKPAAEKPAADAVGKKQKLDS